MDIPTVVNWADLCRQDQAPGSLGGRVQDPEFILHRHRGICDPYHIEVYWWLSPSRCGLSSRKFTGVCSLLFPRCYQEKRYG